MGILVRSELYSVENTREYSFLETKNFKDNGIDYIWLIGIVKKDNKVIDEDCKKSVYNLFIKEKDENNIKNIPKRKYKMREKLILKFFFEMKKSCELLNDYFVF